MFMFMFMVVVVLLLLLKGGISWPLRNDVE